MMFVVDVRKVNTEGQNFPRTEVGDALAEHLEAPGMELWIEDTQYAMVVTAEDAS